MNTTPTSATITKIPTNMAAAGEIESFVMANCRSMLLSSQNGVVEGVANYDGHVGRMFECKTCGRKFPSFQALGGHRASHKKAKSPNSGDFSDEANIPAKPKIHACKICGDEFPIGQALGGHMRRHREVLGGNNGSDDEKKMLTMTSAVSSVTTEGSFGNSDANNEKKRKIVDDKEEVMLEVDDKEEVPIAKKSSSCKKVRLDLDLDLSLWWKKEQLEEYNNAVEKENNVDHEIEEGDLMVEQGDDEEEFLKLDLSLPTYR